LYSDITILKNLTCIKLIILDLKVFFDKDSRTVAMEVGIR